MTDGAIALLLAGSMALVFVTLALVGRRRRRPEDGRDLATFDHRLMAVEKGLEGTQHDVRNIRMVVNNLPSKEVAHRLEIEVVALAGKLSKVEAEVSATTRACDRIEDILLKGTKL